MIIRLASQADYENVKNFYYKLTDEMNDAQYKPGWEKDVYPDQNMLINAINNNELYVGIIDDVFVSSMIINSQYNEGYKKVGWPNEVSDEEIKVIHALGVDRSYSGKGIAKEMTRKAIDLASLNGAKVIRLDVLEGNIPAEKAYASVGFKYVDMLQMYYEDTGWTNYKLFEYVLGGIEN